MDQLFWQPINKKRAEKAVIQKVRPPPNSTSFNFTICATSRVALTRPYQCGDNRSTISTNSPPRCHQRQLAVQQEAEDADEGRLPQPEKSLHPSSLRPAPKQLLPANMESQQNTQLQHQSPSLQILESRPRTTNSTMQTFHPTPPLPQYRQKHRLLHLCAHLSRDPNLRLLQVQ